MTQNMITYLIVCPLVFLGSMIDAIAGGGGLITLPAYMIAGLPPHAAIATNKMSSSVGTLTATVRYTKEGFIPWREAPFYIVCALIGSAIGARFALLIDERVFRIVMLVILPVTAFYVMRKKAASEDRPPLPAGKTRLICMAVALVIGVYDGFYGPGTGTFLILLLTGLAHLSLEKANGITKAINLASNLGALTVYLMNGRVLLPLGLVAGIFSITGNYLGTKLFVSGGIRIVKPVMLIVLALFFIRVLTEL